MTFHKNEITNVTKLYIFYRQNDANNNIYNIKTAINA